MLIEGQVRQAGEGGFHDTLTNRLCQKYDKRPAGGTVKGTHFFSALSFYITCLIFFAAC
jgi:hypothetical protein